MDRSDDDLVASTLAGETAAFDELARRHGPALLRLASSMIGDADEAASLVQEAMARVLPLLETYDPARPFGPWLRGIVLNLCRNHLRDRTRHARPVDPQCFAEAAAPEGRRRGVLSAIIRRETAEHTFRAIAQLPIPLREVFVLRFVEGMDYADISQLTGLNPATLRVRAHRARALLRDSLGSVVDTWLLQAPPDISTPSS